MKWLMLLYNNVNKNKDFAVPLNGLAVSRYGESPGEFCVVVCKCSARESLRSVRHCWNKTPRITREDNLCVQKKKRKYSYLNWLIKALALNFYSNSPGIWIFTGMPNGASPTVLPSRSALCCPRVSFSVKY